MEFEDAETGGGAGGSGGRGGGPEGSGGSGDGGPEIVNASLCKIGARVPQFWPEEPDIWFAQVEGQFAMAGITADTTKFNYVIGQLENRFAKEVKDIIVSPPATGKYEKLKAELIKRLSASNENKLKQLLMHEELGDRKPSQFLRHLKSLGGDDIKPDFIKTIWLSRLPSSIQTVLAGQPTTTSNDDLADLADRIRDISTPTVAAVNRDVKDPVLSSMTREIAELRKQLRDLTAGGSSHNRSRSRSRSKPGGGGRGAARDRSASRTRSQSNYRKFPLCWYHGKYSEKAARCVKPCDYKAEN